MPAGLFAIYLIISSLIDALFLIIGFTFLSDLRYVDLDNAVQFNWNALFITALFMSRGISIFFKLRYRNDFREKKLNDDRHVHFENINIIDAKEIKDEGIVPRRINIFFWINTISATLLILLYIYAEHIRPFLEDGTFNKVKYVSEIIWTVIYIGLFCMEIWFHRDALKRLKVYR